MSCAPCFDCNAASSSGSDVRRGHPFVGSDGEAVIVSLDTLATDGVFASLCEPAVEPYDLVVFDEAHKLSASRTGRRVDKTRRYALAEALAGVPGSRPAFGGLAWAARHLLLLTATPHMGRESPYHHLWRLLDPQVFEAAEALRRFPVDARQRHFIRRTKEEMVDLDGNPLYRPRMCATFNYDLTSGEDGEQALYDRTTAYLRQHYDRALGNRPAVELAMSVFQRSSCQFDAGSLEISGAAHREARRHDRRLAGAAGSAVPNYVVGRVG